MYYIGFVYLFVFVNKPAFSQEEFSTPCIYVTIQENDFKKPHT